MTRYTAKEREQAALLCAIAASSMSRDTTWGASDGLGRVSPHAADLADDAYWAVSDSLIRRVDYGCEVYAEAEAWIRSGWSPGDKWTDDDRKRAGLAPMRGEVRS